MGGVWEVLDYVIVRVDSDDDALPRLAGHLMFSPSFLRLPTYNLYSYHLPSAPVSSLSSICTAGNLLATRVPLLPAVLQFSLGPRRRLPKRPVFIPDQNRRRLYIKKHMRSVKGKKEENHYEEISSTSSSSSLYIAMSSRHE